MAKRRQQTRGPRVEVGKTIRHEGKEFVILHAGSVEACLARAGDEGAQRWASCGRTNAAKESWDFGLGFDGAMRLGREGWEEGRKFMSEALTTLAPHVEPHRVKALDISGAYPSMPDACAGNPACMVSEGTEARASVRVIRMIVDCSLRCTTGSETARNRGAAVLSVVDALENRGIRVELEGVKANRERSADGAFTRVYYTIKRADEVLDLDRLAFVLVHPAWNRRVMFGVEETYPELARLGHAYGHQGGLDVARDPGSEEAFYLEGIWGNDAEWATLEKARETLAKRVEAWLEAGGG